jgi:hypothetical protein
MRASAGSPADWSSGAGGRQPLRQPGRFTELFFLDEATAFAAGHRPCALCRHEDYVRFGQIWAGIHGHAAGADAIDAELHSERLELETRERRLHRASPDELPDGAFVAEDHVPWVVVGAELRRWTPAGYSERRHRPSGRSVSLLTPPSLVAVLRAGWDPVVPLLHPSVIAGG